MRRVGSISAPSRYLSRPTAASPHGRLPARCRPSAPQGAAPPCAAGREEPGQPREPGTGRGPSGIGRDRAGSGRASAALPARRPGASPAGTQLGSSPPGAARGAPGGTSQVLPLGLGLGLGAGRRGQPKGTLAYTARARRRESVELGGGMGLGTVLGVNRAAEVGLFRS